MAAGTVTPDQVYAQVISQGGTTEQAQVAAALVDGIESGGQLNDQNPTSTASGLFQFLDTTWDNYGGVGHAGNATFQQQVAKFISESQGNNFYAWAPDLGSSYNGSGTLTTIAPGSPVANKIAQLQPSFGTAVANGGMTTADWQALNAAEQAGGGAYLSALQAQQQSSSAASGGAAATSATSSGSTGTGTTPSSTEIAGTTYTGSAQNTGALSTIESNLQNYGFNPTQISQLTNWAWGEITNGVDPTQIAIDLQNQPAFQQQFPYFNQINQSLIASNQQPLNISTYQSLSQQYLQTAQAGGLPAGMVTQADIATLMEGNVSPNEFSARVNSAMSYVLSTPAAQDAFNQYFAPFYAQSGVQVTPGKPLTLGQMAAIVMNPQTAEPLIQQQITTAQIGGASVTSGVGALDANTAGELAKAGITPAQATSTFQNIAPLSALETARPGMGGEAAQGTVSPEQLATGNLLGTPAAQRQEQTAIEVAKAPFSGGGGFVSNTKGVAGAGSASDVGAGNT